MSDSKLSAYVTVRLTRTQADVCVISLETDLESLDRDDAGAPGVRCMWLALAFAACAPMPPVSGVVGGPETCFVSVGGSGYGDFGRDPFTASVTCDGDFVIDGVHYGTFDAVTDVDAAGESVAVVVGGRIWGWGNDPAGSMAGVVTDTGDVQLLRDGCWREVVRDKQGATGCAIDCDGGLTCWGQNFLGKVDPDGGGGLHDVVEARHNGCWRAVSIGLTITCAISCDDEASCWGTHAPGGFPGVPVAMGWRGLRRVPELDGADEISLGSRGNCARFGPDVYCWGAQRNGELGTGSCDGGHSGLQPVDLPPVGSIGGPSTSHGTWICATLSGGGSACWGEVVPGGCVSRPVTE